MTELNRRDGDYAAVARAFEKDAEIREMVIERLSPLPAALRDVLVAQLDDFSVENEFVKSRLIAYDLDSNASVKVRASYAYYRRLSRSGANLEYERKVLAEAIACYGPVHEERRQAALAGILALGQLDLLRDAAETLGAPRSHWVPVQHHTTPNLTLLHIIGRHWNLFRDPELRQHLTEHSLGNVLEPPWESLALVAADYPLLATDLLAWVEGASQIDQGALNFIAKTRPRSKLVQSACLSCMRRRGSNAEDRYVAYSAAETIASQFGGDPDVERALVAFKTPHGLPPPVFIALCNGWPESSELLDGFKRLEQDRSEVPWEAFYPIIFRFWPTDACYDAITKFLSGNVPFRNPELRRRFLSACTNRLKVDAILYRYLVDSYCWSPNPDLQVGLPRLLAPIGGLSAFGRHIITKKLDRELQHPNGPAVGYDFWRGDYRSVAATMLEVFSTM